MVKQERATHTRTALIRAAAEVFAEEGYQPASLTAISGRAGFSNGAIHFHFDTKQKLAEAIEHEAAQAVGCIIQQAEEGSDDGTLQTLIDAMHVLIRRSAQDSVVRAGLELGQDLGYDRGRTLWREWHRWVEKTLRRAEKDGRLAAAVAPVQAAAAVVAVTIGFETLGRELDERRLRECVTAFWDLLLPGMAAGGTRSGVTSSPSEPDPDAPDPDEPGPDHREP